VWTALLVAAASFVMAAPAAGFVWVPRPPRFVGAKIVPVTRYATPDGSSSPLNPCDDSGNPCTLTRAIATSGRGDEIVLEPGDYPESQTISLQTTVYLHGVAGQPRPRILSTAYGGSPALYVPAPAARVRYLEVQHDGVGMYLAGASDSAREVVVRTNDNYACEGRADGVAFVDTLCIEAPTSGGYPAVGLYPGLGNSHFYLRNVTAVGSYAGLQASGGTSTGVDATVVNSIVKGGRYDIYTRATSPGFAKVYLSYSNYDRSHSLEQDNSLIWNSGNNQSTLPLFVNATVPTDISGASRDGDYHEAAGSPTIDAGQTDDANNGPFDFDGDPRTAGPVTDIGADEFESQPASSLSTGAPAFTSTFLSYGAFAADLRGPITRLAARRQPALGTIINYTLSKRARVTFTIANARSRFLGRFAQPGRAGPNSKPWPGKLGKQRLSPGTYRLTLLAVDGRGRRSRSKRITFKVVRP
jgi:hypothetical protein